MEGKRNLRTGKHFRRTKKRGMKKRKERKNKRKSWERFKEDNQSG